MKSILFAILLPVSVLGAPLLGGAVPCHNKISTERTIMHSAEEANVEILNFDDLHPNGTLLALSEKPYHNLTFSGAFMVTNISDNLIPDAYQPLSKPNLVVVLSSGDDEDVPTLKSATPNTFFTINQLAVAPMLGDGNEDFEFCFTGYEDEDIIDGLCGYINKEEKGLKVLDLMTFGVYNRVEIEVLYEGQAVDYIMDDVVVEWAGSDEDDEDDGENGSNEVEESERRGL